VAVEGRDGPDQQQVREALREAVEGVLREHGEYPTRWTLMAEAMGGDGERSFWLTCGESTQPWDILGLAAFADALTRESLRARED
jgi:hypothetical protein